MIQNDVPENTIMDLSKNLKRLLAERGMKITHLSKVTGVPVQTIKNWLSRQPPRNISQVKAVCKYFDVSLDELIYSESHLTMAKIKDGIAIGKFEVILRPADKVQI